MTDVIMRKVDVNKDDMNRAPISGTPGDHPVGTGAGAASGGIAGAAVGTVVGGPIGAVIGAAVGAVVGGMAGTSATEAVNPTAEELYWKESFLESFALEPHYVKGRAYEYYAPGFRAGWEGRVRHHGRSFEEVEPAMKAAFDATKSELDPDWQEVRPAARAAWDRVDRNLKSNH